MADAATSAIVNLIFDKLADEAFKTYVRAQGIYSELENLGRELSLIQAVLHDASDKEITQISVKQWLNSLQHLAYDIDDLLDDVATEATRHELTQESAASTSKVRKFIPTCCTKFLLSHRLSPKLDSMTTQLQQLYKAKADLGLIVKDEKQKDTSRGNETSLLESDVVGREGEKKRLLNRLLVGESYKEKFSIVPIVGMGGVGKTTLARLLYNDTRVKDHFELKAWVCVSDDFDIFKLSNTIFQSVTIENKKFEDLNTLQTALTEQFQDKRFLLVLDDVWTENYDHWDKVVRPLRSAAPGSRIIITTRKKELLKMLGFDQLDIVKSLSFEDALSLLALHALGVDNFDSCPTLREKGEAIVKRCGTLPLALKAIGRLLRTKTLEKWDDVLYSKIWDLKYAGDLSTDWKVIFPTLMLSYHDLSANLKRLFAYCSLFPKDFMYDKEELVLLWMAEGFLCQSNATKSQECSGQEDFEALLSRSFFQHAPNDDSLYVMHDLMNDLATYVAHDFFSRFENHTDMAKEVLTKYRHMSFIAEEYEAYHKFKPLKKARSLRTLLAIFIDHNFQYQYVSNKILSDLLPQVPLLRVLSLSDFKISNVPDCIGSLKHLRYLNLSRTKIKELPENICNLINLQTLIVFGCFNLKTLPKSFLMLKKLRHFDLRDTPFFLKLPLGIGELKCLQSLTKIIIGGDGGFAINDLKRLNNLHGELSIEGLCKVKSALHAHEAKLSLKRLTKLRLNWGDGSQNETLAEDVLKELQPDSERLKELVIKSYQGIEFPKRVAHPSFHQLVQISIRNCNNCTSLPPFGQLPSLKGLFIDGMDEVKFIGSDLTGTSRLIVDSFPSLKILSFRHMEAWEIWSTNNEVLDAVFPYLQDLELKECPKLTEVSLKTFLSLKILRFRNVCGWKVWSTNEDFQLPCLEELHIEDCPNFIEFSPEALPSLEYLRFDDMLGWKTWSTNDIAFPCLRNLYITNCPNLVDVSAEALPLLRVLKISGCGYGVLRSLVQAAPSITMLEIRSILGLTYEVWTGIIKHIGAVEEVSISKCDEIRYLWESEEEASKVLVNIKKLNVSFCSNLVSLGEKEEEDNFGSSFMSSFRVLKVMSCHNMERCFCPNSIESLHISSCSSITHVSFSTAATGGGQKLRSLVIDNCINLEEKINNISMVSLESIRLFGWTSLKSIIHLGNFNYLTDLHISQCSSIESFPDIELPVLTSLRIHRCESIKSFSAIQLPVLTSLEIHRCESIKSFSAIQLPVLTSLSITECESMESFPDIELPVLTSLTIQGCESIKSFSAIQLPVLTSLSITECESLESFSALQMTNLTCLKDLRITNCPSFAASNHRGLWAPNLQFLSIGRLKEPISDWAPRNFLTSVDSLELYGDPYLSNFKQLSDLFPSSITKLRIRYCDKLESLSVGFEHLTSLQHLYIYNCPKLKHLPKYLLPSLLTLRISECPNLTKRCKGRGSHYYPLISHIPRIRID